MASGVDELLALLQPATRVLAFTGAGISTNSGIPDFRGPQGVWRHRQPVYFDEFLASEDKRVEYWEGKVEVFDSFRDARPTPSHRALVELERLGRLHGLVTQNIDGLHQAAGTSAALLVELHGTNRLVECLKCERLDEPDAAVSRFRESGRPPTCGCGGLMKFATISFGQALKPHVMTEAERLARGCDLVLALGSTLSVYPAASVPLFAAHGGAPYVIVNRGPTEHDARATLKLDEDIDAVLPPAVAALASPGPLVS